MDVVVAYAYAYPGGAIAEELTDVELAIAGAVVVRVSTLRIVTILGRTPVRRFGFAGMAGLTGLAGFGITAIFGFTGHFTGFTLHFAGKGLGARATAPGTIAGAKGAG